MVAWILMGLKDICSGLRMAVAAVIPVKPTTTSTIRLPETPMDTVIILRSLIPDRIPLRMVMVYVLGVLRCFHGGKKNKKKEDVADMRTSSTRRRRRDTVDHRQHRLGTPCTDDQVRFSSFTGFRFLRFLSQQFTDYWGGGVLFPPFGSCSGYGRPAPPPSEPVAFGHGAPQGYNFQYSRCTGKRKALLVGINYFGQKGQLRGCINDAKNLSSYLNQSFGYAREDMVILTDDQQNPMSQPTKANILRAMHWLVKDAQPNDSLFFHYSGELFCFPFHSQKKRGKRGVEGGFSFLA